MDPAFELCLFTSLMQQRPCCSALQNTADDRSTSSLSVLLSADAVYVLCYSLILLSIDLSSPHVKNKMSKREFIRNTRRAAHNVSDDFVGHLYDNIYLIGHVAA